jgi:hypothetical protein
MEEASCVTSHHGEQGVDGREAADPAAIPFSADKAEKTLRVAGRYGLEHLSVLALDPPEEIRRDPVRIAEPGPHVGEIGPRDEADLISARLQEVVQGIEELSHRRIPGGDSSAEDPFVE